MFTALHVPELQGVPDSEWKACTECTIFNLSHTAGNKQKEFIVLFYCTVLNCEFSVQS